MNLKTSKTALVTGASTGIGYELAKLCASCGYDLIIAADEQEIEKAGNSLREFDVNVEAVTADLSTPEGVDTLLAVVGDRTIDLLLANAGLGLGKAFVDQEWARIRRIIDTNVTGTVYLVHVVAKRMIQQGSGRILFTGSIAGFMPGTYQAVYNATKSFINSFAIALRHELNSTGVTVTVLMPGATDTLFFQRADMLDTDVGRGEKDDPAEVAKAGFEAMMSGEESIVSGWKNKVEVALSNVTPAGVLAERHRKMAKPNSVSDGPKPFLD